MSSVISSLNHREFFNKRARTQKKVKARNTMHVTLSSTKCHLTSNFSDEGSEQLGELKVGCTTYLKTSQLIVLGWCCLCFSSGPRAGILPPAINRTSTTTRGLQSQWCRCIGCRYSSKSVLHTYVTSDGFLVISCKINFYF